MNCNIACVALGSNLGEPAKTLARAAGRMDGILPGVRLAALSRVWHSAPHEIERLEAHPLPEVLRAAYALEAAAGPGSRRQGPAARDRIVRQGPGPSPGCVRGAGQGGEGSASAPRAPAPWYANMAARLECDPRVTPETLFEALMALEAEMGRDRIMERRWGPRVIDIDLILFSGETRATPWLTLPHPRWEMRAFVALPLAEVAPGAVSPEIFQRLSFCSSGTMLF